MPITSETTLGELERILQSKGLVADVSWQCRGVWFAKLRHVKSSKVMACGTGANTWDAVDDALGSVFVGDLVMVKDAVDREDYDVAGHIGRAGRVIRHDDGGGGTNVMHVVQFVRGDEEAFWDEELDVRRPSRLRNPFRRVDLTKS